jgi:hypothetical protein
MDGDKMLETQREGDNEVLITRVATGDELVSVSNSTWIHGIIEPEVS